MLGQVVSLKEPSAHEYEKFKRKIRALDSDEKRELRQEIQSILESRDAVRKILRSLPSSSNVSEAVLYAFLLSLLKLLGPDM